MMVVLVVMVDADVFRVVVCSRELVLLISKTLFGARSSGFMTICVPDSGQSSIMMPSCSSGLGSSDVVLLEVKLETDDPLRVCERDSPEGVLFVVGAALPVVSVSAATRAALTSGSKDAHTARTDFGSPVVGASVATVLAVSSRMEARASSDDFFVMVLIVILRIRRVRVVMLGRIVVVFSFVLALSLALCLFPSRYASDEKAQVSVLLLSFVG
mmetsp:Transcript_7571/g.20498  ORF Transcript_7571/g.20498 Transcript_7571/m.20498 type:complete len:214 (+) Transcript_7571:1576-2217(+)